MLGGQLTGATTLNANATGAAINIGSAVNASSFTATADQNVSINGAVTSGSTVFLRSTIGTVLLNEDVTAGTVLTLESPQVSTLSGTAVVTAGTLVLLDGGATPTYTLQTNVGNLAGTINSNLSLVNAKALAVGSTVAGGLTVGTAVANLSLTTTVGNINVAGALSLNPASTLVLNAAGSVTIGGFVNSAGGTLNATAQTGSISASGAINLGAGTAILTSNTGVTASQLNVATVNASARTSGSIDLRATAPLSVQKATTASATGNVSVYTSSGDLTIAGPVAGGATSGSVTLWSAFGNIDVRNTVTANTVTLNAAKGLVSNTSSANLTTKNLNFIASAGDSVGLLTSDAVSNYSTLNANIIDDTNPLVVLTGRDLTLQNITTTSGLVHVTVNNAAATPNLTITGPITAGGLGAYARENVTLTANQGAITSSGGIVGNVVTFIANSSSTVSGLTNDNVTLFQAAIKGEAENLTVTSSSDTSLSLGSVSTANGTITIDLSGSSRGNIIRTGGNVIDAGSFGSVVLRAGPTGGILGNGLIDADLFDFRANAAPSIAAADYVLNTGASFRRLAANLTQSGDLAITRSTDLTLESAVLTSGNVSVTIDSGVVGADTLTINGPVGGASSNVTFSVLNGSVTTTAVAGAITANALNVATHGDLALNTSANTLVANVGGNLTINETNGLTIGAANVVATNNITLNVATGNLTRTGKIESTSTTDNIALTATTGSINGTGLVTGANAIIWTSKGDATIDSSVAFGNLSVTSTAGNVAVTHSGAYDVLNASGVGNVSLNGTAAINIDGNVSSTGNVTLNSTASAITVDPTARVSGQNLTVNGTGATLYTNVTNITGVLTGDLTVNELNDLTINATNVNVTGNATFAVGNATTLGNLTVTGELNATGNATLTASNGAITGSGLVTGSLLTVNAKNASSLTTVATNLAATISAGGLTVAQPTGSLGIDQTTGVTAAGPISITTSAGWIGDGTDGVINAGTNNVTLNATTGEIMLNSSVGQITGNVLTLTAGDEVNVNTAVNAIVTDIAGNLTVDENDGLNIGVTAADSVTADAAITLNVAAGNLNGPGSINSTTGGDITLNTAAGAVNLPSPSLVSGGNLNIAAQNTSRVNTNVTAVTSNISAIGQGITFTQSGDLSINGSDFTTQNGSIEIGVTGNLTRTGNIDAGTANVTLIAGGNIVGAGLISGNILNVAAATSSSLNTAVRQLSTNLSAEAAALTVTEADDLIVNTALGVRTTNGAISIVLATGNLTGDGSINAGSPTQGGSITLNAATGGVTLNTSAGQIRGGLLDVFANSGAPDVNLSTNVAELTANIQGAGQQLIVRQTGALVINAASGIVGQDLIDLRTSAGNISGDGVINTTGDVILNAANLVSLDAAADQVRAVNLTVIAANASTLQTNVTDLNASIANGGLTVTDVDDLTITQGQVLTAGAVALTATTGNLTGTGSSGYINAGSNAVTLTAGDKITFNSTLDGQIVGGSLTLVTTGAGGNDVNVKTSVSNLTASVQGNLTVLESGGLTIGTAAGTFVNTTGDLDITLSSGSLTGSGSINSTGNATISLLTAGSVTPTGTITADVLNVSLTQAGGINVSTAANEARLSIGGIGDVTINEADDLTANVIRASQGNVNVTLATGNLSINDAITSGVSNNIILSAVGGNITSTDATNGVIYADRLTITAKNTSSIITTVSTVTAAITGSGAALVITESDDPTYSTPDGLAIGAAGIVSDAGDITLNLLNGNLTATGSVSALNLTSNSLSNSGNITVNVPLGSASIPSTAQIVGNVLCLSVHNSSTLYTNVAWLQDRSAGSYAIDADGTDVIDATAAASSLATTLTYQLAQTNINVATFTATLKYEDSTAVGDPVAYNLFGNADGTISFTADTGFGTSALTTASLDNTTGVLTLTFDQSPLGTQLSADYLRTLTVNNLRDLAIGGGNLRSNSSADIVLNVASGNITSVGAGNIVADAGTANVTLNASSGSVSTTTGPSIINASLLTVTAKNSTTVNTTVSSLVANVTNGTLSVYESDTINIAAGNVVAANAITIVAAGQIGGNGIIRSGAGTQNVTLNADNLSLTAANQVVGNVLTVAVANSSTVRTNVNSITGTVTGNLADLTVTETNSLSIRSGSDLTFANGTLNVTLLSGSLTGSGNIAGGANSSTVNLTAAGGNVTLSTGNVTAVNLILTARDTSSVNTVISNVAANVTVGGLTITEKNDLNIGLGIAGSNSVIAAGGLSITAGGASNKGNIASGAGASTLLSGGSGNVSLTTSNGSITLNEAANLVSGSRLNLISQNDVAVNTAVSSLVANVTNGNLTVREADDLQIGANVTTTKGDIDIRLGGNLSVAGAITSNAGENNLTLNSTAGWISGTGLMTANVVAANAVKTSSLNLSANTVVAGVSGEGQSLTVTNTKTITLDGPGTSAITTANGSISVSSTAGNIAIKDAVNAGSGNITFAASNGNVSTSGTGKVSGNVLTVTAKNSSVLNTAVTSVAANITTASGTLTVNDDDGLAIAAAGVMTNNGILTLTAGGTAAGTLTIANAITAGNANMVLKNAIGGIVGTTTINANVLTVNATGDSSLSTNVNQVQGQITGTRSLTINQVAAANGLKIGASDLNIGSGTLNLNIANGSLTGTAAVNGKLLATTGAINVNVAKGNIGDASTNTVIDAGTGSVSLNAAAGSVTLNNVANQVKGGALSLNALGTSTLRTDVTSVVGSITGSGNTLTIVDNNALTIGLVGLTTNNGNLSVQTGTSTVNSNLTVSGPLSAGTRAITLNAPNGTIGGAGLITATNLSINSSGATTVSTNIGNLSATTTGAALTVTEANDLSINAAGINTAGGAVTIALATGNLGGSGAINAGAGDVTLKTAAGNVTLTTAQAVKANNLSLTALNSSAINTTVANITATISGPGQTLTVNETNDLALSAAGITTSNGNVALKLAGNLTGSGKLALGTGTATLTSTAGNITPAGTITADTLVLTAQNTSSVTTTITSLQAKVSSGGLTVTETADLAIAAGGVSTANAATLNVLAGNLTGTGNVIASDPTTGNVTLNVAAGNVTLNTIAGQVRAGNVLTISANTTSVVNSNVANLTATIRNGGLTVVEANNLNIVTGGINTSGVNGPISLTLTTGSLSSGSNLVNAGLGNVAISAAGGTVTLNGTAGQVAGNVLTLAARGDTTVKTAVNTLDAVLTTTTGTGNLSVIDTNDLAVNRAVTTNGNVTLNVGANTLTVNNISAARATLGDVTLIAKNVVVNGVGITASDNLDLTGVTGNVNVTAGVMNAASVSQTAGSRVNWQVNTLESGAGSLRSVITNTNSFKGKSQVNIATPTTITLASSLPWISSDLRLLGNNNLTINAGSAATGFVFNGASASVSNVALSGFSGTAITLLANRATGITINGVNVTNSAVGLQASGIVTGSTVSNSTFDGKSRANATGISLSGTSGLTISKNTLQNATIGLQASGSFTNTLVQTNTFDRLSRYGISLASATSTGPATGLVIGPATGSDYTLANTMTNITGSGTAGVFATGFCTNTVVRKTVFRNVTNPFNVARSRNLTIVN